MKRILFVAVLVCFGISALAADLEISVNPDNPLLIPVSSPASVSGPIAPYFTMNNLKITWKGSQSLQLTAVAIVQQGTGRFMCGGSGVGITSIFANSKVVDCNGNPPGGPGRTEIPALDPNGNLTIPPGMNASSCALTVESSSFYCDKLNVQVLNNPFASYNIHATVTVYGETLDASGKPGHRVMATKEIVIQ